MATFFRNRARLVSGGVTALSTYYWDSTGGTPAAIATEAGARVRAMWESYKANIGGAAVITVDGFGDEIDETNGQIVGQFVGTPPAVVNATGVGDILPLQTQALIRLGTSTFIAGRRVQGRIYVPYALESASTGGVPIGAVITALTTAAGLLGTTIVTGISQRVWHRPADPVLGPATPGLSVVVTSRSVAPTWSVLRSRRD